MPIPNVLKPKRRVVAQCLKCGLPNVVVKQGSSVVSNRVCAPCRQESGATATSIQWDPYVPGPAVFSYTLGTEPQPAPTPPPNEPQQEFPWPGGQQAAEQQIADLYQQAQAAAAAWQPYLAQAAPIPQYTPSQVAQATLYEQAVDALLQNAQQQALVDPPAVPSGGSPQCMYPAAPCICPPTHQE